MNIVIISGDCCIPGMAAFDEQARFPVLLSCQRADRENSRKIVGAKISPMPEEIVRK